MDRKKSISFLLLFQAIIILYPVIKSDAQTNDSAITNESTISVKYFMQANAGVGIGLGYFKQNVINGYQVRLKNDELFYSITAVNGILLNNRTGLGIGVGVQPWTDGLFFPVFLHAFYNLGPKENTFYGAASLGYSFGTRYATVHYESGTGGLMLGLAIGYKMNVLKRLKFEYEAFYNYQSVSSRYYFNTLLVDYTVPYHFAGFRIGVEFH
jgi:hypothetical protein